MYILKADGVKVQMFENKLVASAWARRHCKYAKKVEIVSLTECEMPRAEKPIRPILDMPDLRYKPFASLG